jgi:hypothetical protein
MEDVDRYRELVKEIIREYATHKSSYGEIESEVIFDEANDHYELMRTGWHGPRRIHGSAIHIDIRGGKVWIQHDGTPDGIADILVERGVPKDRIVLAFQSPRMREYTDFAVA